ncbi:MAG: pyruvate carboxylase [Nevskiaceae bacterium]|nr:MAG: pyruvate carboxylase [Nevskiaceae bacterium]TBR71797.1 MAG: pyruvate carboxylase [Nevskiaceae bacterium]
MTDAAPFRRLLVANRGEIAIRVMRAAAELGIQTVAIYSEEDRFSLHRFKADQSYRVGTLGKPLAAYLDIDSILETALAAGVDAIHPGYGFLSENPDFAERCVQAGITFIGPTPDAMRRLGNKVSARELAHAAGAPTVPASGPLPEDDAGILAAARPVGYPLMCKASWGGGGRGMREIMAEQDLVKTVREARHEAASAFGNGEVYVEKLIRRASHIEVQILGDTHGNLVHLFERDCSVQRRHQKVVERAPAPYMDAHPETRQALCEAALAIGRVVNYSNAGTVEFLLDRDSGAFYFIEVNPRIQVEHTVTEEVTGIDIVKAQIRIAAGGRIGTPESGVPPQREIRLKGHAVQCRVTTEDPENHFVPDYGRLLAYRSPAGFGIRLDAGTAYGGAVITPYYDSLLVKVTAWAPTADEACARMDRALREFRIRGLSTNIRFVLNVVDNPAFRSGECTTSFIDDTPALFEFKPRRDRATRLLHYLADVIVNGNPQVAGRPRPVETSTAPLPQLPHAASGLPEGTRDLLHQLGPAGFSRWLREQERVLVTDTTMRDAHQSLIATRMRSFDMLGIAPAYAGLLPQLLSLECWGGATFDVALRFLHEDPWDRLRGLRAALPNVLLQMLLRASNAVGYTSYPDNAVRFFVQQAAKNGIDLFRVFDSLNDVENMRVAMDAVLETGALCEAAICYTGNVLAGGKNRYDLAYYVRHAKALEQAGAHILSIKDMAGVCRPAAIRLLVKTLREETALPLHFHTHDTSGIASASVLAAAEAGCDAVDAAMAPWSGVTAQPNLDSIAAALRDTPRDTGLDADALRDVARYWEVVRQSYAAFEGTLRSGTADVYRHAMPGGQYSNLRAQARALGVDHRWPEVANAYAQVNTMFGDIVKVTPTSKVVGDMALFMVTSGITAEQVLDPAHDIDFPESVTRFFRGELGRPEGGFPPALQKKVLKGEHPIEGRPGAALPPADLDAARATTAQLLGTETASDTDLASYLMYPAVFKDYARHRREYGDLAIVPTPAFFYGLKESDEIAVDLERGKTLVIRYLTTTREPNDKGQRRVFFELNGQSRAIVVTEQGAEGATARPKADPTNAGQVAAPMPGMVGSVAVEAGRHVEAGDALLTVEAMKMETTISAPCAGTVREVLVAPGARVEAKDLLVRIEAA